MTSLSVKSRYRILCKLYNKYKLAMLVALENVPENKVADEKTEELESIMRDIEKFPIPWKFYKLQRYKFPQEFEDLIVFISDNI